MTEADLGLAAFDRLLEETRRSLMRPGPVGDWATDIRGEGTAADGQITAVVAGGRLQSLRMDPRAMRMGSEALCGQVVLAVNAALDDLRGSAAGRPPATAAVDTAALAERMGELQSQSVRQMAAFIQGINDVLARIQRATGTGPGTGNG